MKQARILKVVVASPGDVQAERDMIPAIVDELNKGIADERGVRLEVYRWETDAYPAFHPLGPQGQIDSCLRIDDCDLLIAIFWKRFGTPVLDADSGTEHEIRVALEACEKMGRPQLMLYFNQAPHDPQSKAEKDQWQQVLDFKQSLSQKVLWWEYHGKDELCDFVRQHLTKFIRGDYSGRPLEELLQAYRDYLTCRVSTVRIFSEAETRPLEKVFVELTLTEEYERPTRNAQWLGMMDAELRRRRDIFARDDEDRESGSPEKERKKEKRTLKPDELLRRRTQAVIVGAPGCGKTTLLRYLTLKTLQANKRFPVFLELKSLSEKAFEAAEGNWVELLFAKAIAAPLGLSAAETERLKAFFLAHLKHGEVTIFLDGLDEVAGSTFFNALCRSANEFMASAYRHNELIISTRPYALQQRFEGLQEMEIASLSPRQIEAFLQHYYGNEPTNKKLQQELRRRRELREMACVPFPLSVIAYLYRQQGEIVGERLELYRQLVQQLVTQLDREKNVERFLVKDRGGLLKQDFLKHLAYERLFVDEVDNEAERLILTVETIFAKAHTLCQTLPNIDPYELADDIKATPLLREIGADIYAFVHLTLQEYLAAVALAEQPDCEKIFCRAYFNPTLAEMEVLPMTLGLARKPNDFYAALEGLPESLNFVNLRLQARSLAYIHNLNREYQMTLVNRLIDFVVSNKPHERPYALAIINSFSSLTSHSLEYLLKKVREFSRHPNKFIRYRTIFMLAKIADQQTLGILTKALQNEDDDIRKIAAKALGLIGTPKAIKALVYALRDKKRYLLSQKAIIEALGHTSNKRVVSTLLQISRYVDSDTCKVAARVAYEMDKEIVVKKLLIALENDDCDIRLNAAIALGGTSDEGAIDALVKALDDEDEMVGWAATIALGEIGGEEALKGLLIAIKHHNVEVRVEAAEILGYWDTNQRVREALLKASKDKDSHVRLRAACALARIGDNQALDALIPALKNRNNDGFERCYVAFWLGELRGKRALQALLCASDDPDSQLRAEIANVLGKFKEKDSSNVLLSLLKDNDEMVRMDAAISLGKIGNKRILKHLLKASADRSIYVRCATLRALCQIDTTSCIKFLLAALNDEAEYVQDFATKLFEKNDQRILRQALEHEDARVRYRAVKVTGYSVIDRQFFKKLQHLASVDSSKEVRTAAREAAEKYANKLRYFSE